MPNPRHRITVERSQLGRLSTNSIGTDALNGVGAIPGVSDLEIEKEETTFVTLSYVWTGACDFEATDEHLSQYGLRRKWDAK